METIRNGNCRQIEEQMGRLCHEKFEVVGQSAPKLRGMEKDC
jgi:hypothetical protein